MRSEWWIWCNDNGNYQLYKNSNSQFEIIKWYDHPMNSGILWCFIYIKRDSDATWSMEELGTPDFIWKHQWWYTVNRWYNIIHPLVCYRLEASVYMLSIRTGQETDLLLGVFHRTATENHNIDNLPEIMMTTLFLYWHTVVTWGPMCCSLFLHMPCHGLDTELGTGDKSGRKCFFDNGSRTSPTLMGYPSTFKGLQW